MADATGDADIDSALFTQPAADPPATHPGSTPEPLRPGRAGLPTTVGRESCGAHDLRVAATTPARVIRTGRTGAGA